MDEVTHDVDVGAEATGEWHLPTGGLVFRRPAEAPPVLHLQHSSLIECQFRLRQWRLLQGSRPRWPGAGCPGWHVQHPAAASCPTPHFWSSWWSALKGVGTLLTLGKQMWVMIYEVTEVILSGGILCCVCVMSFCGAWWVNFLVTWLNYHDSLKACEEVPLFKGNYQTLLDFYSYLTTGTKPTRYYGKENVKTFIQNEHCKTTNDPGCSRYIDSTDWPPFLNHDLRAGPHKNT